jgi:pimeloyl-ACP methyl ester carboxylesterase
MNQDLLMSEGRHLPAVGSIVRYRTVKGGEIKIFYWEAGPQDGPALLLLHGFPAASHMFRDLIPRLADHFRPIAPDLPGFGTGHFAIETHFVEIAAAMKEFLQANGVVGRL